jgi:branched-chain amino acid transport system substrate-binding protein
MEEPKGNGLKIVGWLVVLVLVLWGVSALFKGKSGVEETVPIKIGLSLPLTGDLAFIGEADRNAALLAIEEINAQTNLKHKYELVIDDDSFTASKAVTVMNKFMSIDKVNAVVSVGSTAGNVIAPLAETNKIPHIGMASDPVVAKGDYNFINWTRPQEEVMALVNELKNKGITKVAIISVNQQGFIAINKDFEEKAKVAGITIVTEVFNQGQTDFKTVISKLQKENPGIYLLNAFDPEIGIIGKQIKNLGIKTPLTSVESFGLTSDATPFEGQWYIDAAVPTATFSSQYQAKYNKTPGPAAPNVYDAVHLLVNAFESVSGKGIPTSAQVAKALSGLNGYTGALGPLTAGPDGAFISQATVKVIKGGKSVSAQ